MISGDGWGLSFPNICITVEEKSWKNLNQENWPDQGSNPGLLGEKQRCYPSTKVVVGGIVVSLKTLLCRYSFELLSFIVIPLTWIPGWWVYNHTLCRTCTQWDSRLVIVNPLARNSGGWLYSAMNPQQFLNINVLSNVLISFLYSLSFLWILNYVLSD